MDAFSLIRNKIYDEMDADISCKEDLELTEGVKNDYYEGTIDAYSKILNYIEAVEKKYAEYQRLEEFKRSLKGYAKKFR